jgi:ELWxxDGT repeat protein
MELWRTDGTPAGTKLVKSINPGPAASTPKPLASIGSVLYLSAFEPVHGRELWRTNGTSAGTKRVKDIDPGPDNSDITRPARLGKKLLFRAKDSGSDTELWVRKP